MDITINIDVAATQYAILGMVALALTACLYAWIWNRFTR